MKYKILEEFERFYLCESEKGYKECFLKNDVVKKYKKDSNKVNGLLNKEI